MAAFRLETVGEGDLADLLPLVRAYCDFYGVEPDDERLLALSRALIANPELEGFQLIARDDAGAARIAVMNDLYVQPGARGTGLAEALIEECVRRARQRGAKSVDWQTAKGNLRAQAVYERVGAGRSEWVDYSLGVEQP